MIRQYATLLKQLGYRRPLKEQKETIKQYYLWSSLMKDKKDCILI